MAASALGIESIFGLQRLESLPVPMLMGFLIGALSAGRVVTAVSVASLGVLLLAAWFPPLGALARGYVRDDPFPAQPLDAIVVLSASVTTDGDLNVHGADRLLGGIELYRAGLAPRLVVSRVMNPINQRTSDEGQRRLLDVTGVAPEVHIVDSVGSTRLEAVRIRDLAGRHGWNRIAVVTSPVHSRRACATFEMVGFEVTCRPSRDRSVALGTLSSAGDRVRAFGEWLYEAMAWREYRIRGWVRPPTEAGPPRRQASPIEISRGTQR